MKNDPALLVWDLGAEVEYGEFFICWGGLRMPRLLQGQGMQADSMYMSLTGYFFGIFMFLLYLFWLGFHV